MAKLTFDIETCKGCGLCVKACPKNLLEIDKNSINKKGYNPAHLTDEAACVSCAACARMCPDCVITVEK